MQEVFSQSVFMVRTLIFLRALCVHLLLLFHCSVHMELIQTLMMIELAWHSGICVLMLLLALVWLNLLILDV